MSVALLNRPAARIEARADLTSAVMREVPKNERNLIVQLLARTFVDTYAHSLGARDLSRSESTRIAGLKAGARDIEVAELHAQFSHEELILREALNLSDEVRINPSGGPLAANPVMATGLIRLGEAAARIHDGSANRTLGHATSGPCLQQNLVCVLSGETNG